MKNFRLATLALATAMSLGIHGYASTSSADATSSVAQEENKNIAHDEIAALQMRAEFDTQAALNQKGNEARARYQPRYGEQAAAASAAKQ